MNAHRDRILAIFERHRAIPGAPFPEDGFLNYLMGNPRGPEAVRNSFAGLRRFNAFIDEVQLEFGVCFSMKDLESNYSLSRFESRIKELERSPRGSLASLKNQVRAGPGWHVLIIGNLLLLASIVGLRSFPLLFAAVVVVAFLANLAFIRLYIRGRKYQAQLANRIRLRETETQ